MRRLLAGLLLGVLGGTTRADDRTAEVLRGLDLRVVTGEKAKDLGRMVSDQQKRRLQEASLRETAAWAKVRTWEDWEKFRALRVQALASILGDEPPAPPRKQVLVTSRVKGPGYVLENIVFESRPGLIVAANLYRPEKPGTPQPGILISHSHHAPKTQGELQDMGMTWARQGCTVLVMDLLGHGERRQHPFHSSADWPKPFKASRQDYYYRYVLGQQLQTTGASLIGWMVQDLRRGVDVLLDQPGVDPKRILLFGAVAGGGDPTGVTALREPRIALAAPFNFGGTQPDYATPEDTDRDFYWFGVPYWESTRCIRNGARDGFAHWVIVGAVAPRYLLHCNEFGWKASMDPVWPRLQKVFALAGKPDRLAAAYGKGILRGSPPENTHCGNIGAYHRGQMYPHLKKWLDFPVPEKEFLGGRRETKELMCVTPKAREFFQPRPVHELALAELPQRPAGKTSPEKQRKIWDDLLGGAAPFRKVEAAKPTVETKGDVVVERLVLTTEPGIVVPVVLLRPAGAKKPPVVVGVAQDGKEGFRKHRAQELASLLDAGLAVCLPDLRGTGETSSGGGRRHSSGSTSISAREQLLGGTMVGGRLRDLRGVLAYLRGRKDIDAGRVALWGEGFAQANDAQARLDVPWEIDPFPVQAEPAGALLALLAGLYENDVRCVLARGGLDTFRSVLSQPYLHVPHDALVPGVLARTDVADLVAGLGKLPVRQEDLRDGANRAVGPRGDVRASVRWLIENLR